MVLFHETIIFLNCVFIVILGRWSDFRCSPGSWHHCHRWLDLSKVLPSAKHCSEYGVLLRQRFGGYYISKLKVTQKLVTMSSFFEKFSEAKDSCQGDSGGPLFTGSGTNAIQVKQPCRYAVKKIQNYKTINYSFTSVGRRVGRSWMRS